MQRLPSSDPVASGWRNIERMLAHVPTDYANELRRRMRTVDINQLQGAWLELLTCHLMRRCLPGWDVVPTCNMTTPTTPDIVMSCNGDRHAIECTVVQNVECDADFTPAAQDLLTRIDDNLGSFGGLLSASVVREGSQLPSAREIAVWLDEWIIRVLSETPLDEVCWPPARIAGSGEAAVLYNDNTRCWSIAFEIMRMPDRFQGRKSSIYGMGSDHTYSPCLDDRMRDAIGKKTRKYIDNWDSLCIALAINNESDDPRDDEVADVMLGETFCRVRRDGTARIIRKPTGLWTKQSSRSKNMPGLLVFHRAFPWSLSSVRVALWQSPSRSSLWFRHWPFDRIALAARNRMERIAGSQKVQTIMADLLQ